MEALTTLHVIMGHRLPRETGGYQFCADVLDEVASFTAASLRGWLVHLDPLFEGTVPEIQALLDARHDTLVITVHPDGHLQFDVVKTSPLPAVNAPVPGTLQ